MTKRPPDSEPGDDGPGDDGPGGEAEHRVPGWVKGLVAVGLVAVVLMLVIFAITGDGHGPGRHRPGGGGPEVHTPPEGHTLFDHG